MHRSRFGQFAPEISQSLSCRFRELRVQTRSTNHSADQEVVTAILSDIHNQILEVVEYDEGVAEEIPARH